MRIEQVHHSLSELAVRITNDRSGNRAPIMQIATLENVDDSGWRQFLGRNTMVNRQMTMDHGDPPTV
jgi:hypothetical protein